MFLAGNFLLTSSDTFAVGLECIVWPKTHRKTESAKDMRTNDNVEHDFYSASA